MKATRHGNWCSIWAWFRWFHPGPTASIPGPTTAPFTASATRSRGSSEGSRASAESSRFEKLDVLFIGFLNFALIVEALPYVEPSLVTIDKVSLSLLRP